MQAMASIFSRIISGDLPGTFLFQDERWVAFLDINPVVHGHLLLVLRREIQSLDELSTQERAEMGLYQAALCACVKEALAVPAASVLVNDGPEAGQIVPHVHVHVIPRAAGGKGLDFSSGPGYDEGEAEAVIARLRAAWRGI